MRPRINNPVIFGRLEDVLEGISHKISYIDTYCKGAGLPGYRAVLRAITAELIKRNSAMPSTALSNSVARKLRIPPSVVERLIREPFYSLTEEGWWLNTESVSLSHANITDTPKERLRHD